MSYADHQTDVLIFTDTLSKITDNNRVDAMDTHLLDEPLDNDCYLHRQEKFESKVVV